VPVEPGVPVPGVDEAVPLGAGDGVPAAGEEAEPGVLPEPVWAPGLGSPLAPPEIPYR
jgi:hypothetical protein